MVKLLLTIILLPLAFAAFGQSCSEMLSQAEQYYRDGQFEDIKPKLCKCFGITGSPGLMTSFRQAVERSVRNRTASKSRFVYSLMMADRDPELERLLKAERLAFNRYDGLRGYPGTSKR